MQRTAGISASISETAHLILAASLGGSAVTLLAFLAIIALVRRHLLQPLLGISTYLGDLRRGIRDGQPLPVARSIEIAHICDAVRDLGETQQALRQMALYDPLTGLANRHALKSASRTGAGRRAPARCAAGAAADRPLQVDQRHPRPRGRRRLPQGNRGAHPRHRARHRHRRAPRRRRIRGHAGRHQQPAHRRRRRRQAHPGAGAAGAARRADAAEHRVDRHLRLPGRRRRPRGADEERRHRDVPRQIGRPQFGAVLRRGHERGGQRAADARARTARRSTMANSSCTTSPSCAPAAAGSKASRR